MRVCVDIFWLVPCFNFNNFVFFFLVFIYKRNIFPFNFWVSVGTNTVRRCAGDDTITITELHPWRHQEAIHKLDHSMAADCCCLSLETISGELSASQTNCTRVRSMSSLKLTASQLYIHTNILENKKKRFQNAMSQVESRPRKRFACGLKKYIYIPKKTTNWIINLKVVLLFPSLDAFFPPVILIFFQYIT